jgi:tripartite-type tricarboxylate transporter receptor subunit TctC
MTTIRRTLLKLAAIGLAAGAAPALHAQAAWPAQPVKMVIPFPPGGPTDLVGRVLAQALSEQMGQNVIVENKPGANANIAAELVARAPADGYTFMYNTSSLALSAVLYSKLNYDALKDFAPVALTAVVPMVLVVHPSVPAKTVPEFIDHLKKNPGKLVYGSAGNGNVTHLGAFQFLQANGLSATHVPYKGSSPALVDLAGGQTQFMTDTINSALPYIRDGRLRALAVTSARRSPVLPDVPTLQESGMAGFEVGAWQGVVMPAKTPPEIVNKLNAEITKALKNPAVLEKLAAQGAQPLGSTPEQYGAYLRSEIQRWGAVAKATGAKLD